MKKILIDVQKCVGCRSCEIACRVAHSETKSIYSAIFEERLAQKRIFVENIKENPVPLNCRHCEDAPCVNACMTGALFKTPNGLTLCYEELCVGCFMCVMVCPFGVINENRYESRIIKCDRCSERDIPACVEACPTKALQFVEVKEYASTKRKEYLTEIVA